MTHSQPTRFLLASLSSALLVSSAALAQEPEDPPAHMPLHIDVPVDEIEPIVGPQMPGFVCQGEPKSAVDGASVAEIKSERDKRLGELQRREVPPDRLAHYHCTIAEIMADLGDHRAEAYFQRAIALNPAEPAYELFYGRYLNGRRGPLIEHSERHFYRALKKLETFEGVAQVGSTNEVATDWSQRGLYNNYQADGLPLLPWQWKAYPYKKDATHLPQAFLAVFTGVAADTNDFWEMADARKFTSELLVYRDRVASDPTVSEAEKERVAEELPRAPLRWDAEARVRIRQNALGALDASFKRGQIVDSQVTDLGQPDERNTVDLQESALRLRRSFNMGPAFDLTLDGGISQQVRVGVVEHLPEQVETLYIYQANPTISRFIGPDKLTMGATYVYFDTQDSTSAPLDEQKRERVIRAAFVNYAFYRPLVAPQLGKGTWVMQRKRHRGWHWFVSGVTDDERFGSTVIKKMDVGGGTAFKGLGQLYDVTLTGTRSAARTVITGANEAGDGFERQPQENQEQSQFRTNLTLMRRIVDPDVTPGMPKALQSLSIALPLRHDIAIEGPKEYENFRAGLDVWTQLSSKGLRGTAFLLNAGVDYQNFYNINRQLFMAHINLRMGWPYFGNNPAY